MRSDSSFFCSIWSGKRFLAIKSSQCKPHTDRRWAFEPASLDCRAISCWRSWSFRVAAEQVTQPVLEHEEPAPPLHYQRTNGQFRHVSLRRRDPLSSSCRYHEKFMQMHAEKTRLESPKKKVIAYSDIGKRPSLACQNFVLFQTLSNEEI